MTTVGLNIRLEARPGKEDDVADLLRRGRAMVDAEPATVAWFGVRLGPSTFGIFDVFPDESGRTTHPRRPSSKRPTSWLTRSPRDEHL